MSLATKLDVIFFWKTILETCGRPPRDYDKLKVWFDDARLLARRELTPHEARKVVLMLIKYQALIELERIGIERRFEDLDYWQ